MNFLPDLTDRPLPELIWGAAHAYASVMYNRRRGQYHDEQEETNWFYKQINEIDRRGLWADLQKPVWAWARALAKAERDGKPAPAYEGPMADGVNENNGEPRPA